MADLERYDLIERIAGGGMGEVFRAKAYGAHGFEKDLAVKRILPRYAEDAEFERRFIDEAKLAVSLSHANIVQVLDFGRLGGSLYLAMEYVDGLDLAELLDTGEPVPLGAALHVASEICKGLDYAHRRGVVHRDISPANVLLSRSGEVKIADFGIARASDTHTTSQIDGVKIVGKLRYMSPEQIRARTVDGQSDIFAAGILFHEMLTGRRLFKGGDIETATREVCEAPIPPVSERRPEAAEPLPEGLDEVIARMLERDRSRRYAAAGDVLRDLARCALRLDPVPTALDVAEVVEEALGDDEAGGRPVHEIDDAIFAELGLPVGEPSRITRASPVGGDEAHETRTISLFRGAADELGLPTWSATGAGTAAGTGTAAGSATEQVRRPAGKRVAIIAAVSALALAAGVAFGLGVMRSDGDSAAADAAADAATATATAADAAPQPVPDAAAVPDAAPQPAVLIVASEPKGASVSIAGEARGVTPLTLKLPAASEPVEVVLELEGHTRVKKTATLVAGETAKVSARLAVARGAVKIFSYPWANVMYRGRKIGQTPTTVRLPHGTHTLTLINPVLNKRKRIRVTVPARKPVRVSL